MNISSDSIVREVVKLNFKTAPLFQTNHIDYCCGGEKAISDACKEVGLDPELLIQQLETLINHKDPESEYITNLSLGELINYIIKRHHTYVRESIPALKKNLERICQVHGEHHKELFRIKELFFGSAGDLTMHMQKEEIMLFPFIKKMELAKSGKIVSSKGPFGSVANPINMMMAEHQDEGDRFKEISNLSNNYLIPEDACTTYEVTLKQLQDFENDLYRHIHLENNILFPKAIELEHE